MNLESVAATGAQPRASFATNVVSGVVAVGMMVVPPVLAFVAGLMTGVTRFHRADGAFVVVVWAPWMGLAVAAGAVAAWLALRRVLRSEPDRGLFSPWFLVRFGFWAALFTAAIGVQGASMGGSVRAPIATSDGAWYRVATQSRTLAIARDDDPSWFGTCVRTVAVDTDRDSESYVLLVRPTGDDATGLRIAPDGTLVYEDRGRYRVAYRPADGSAFADEGLVELSPFVLIDDGGTGSERDVTAIEGNIQNTRWPDASSVGRDFHIPRESVLLDALGSANPWIVETARRFIRAGGPTLYPEATKRM